jgi:hypothetical protein
MKTIATLAFAAALALTPAFARGGTSLSNLPHNPLPALTDLTICEKANIATYNCTWSDIYTLFGGAGGGGSGGSAMSLTGVAVPSYADYMGFNVGGILTGISSTNPLPVVLQTPLSVYISSSTNIPVTLTSPTVLPTSISSSVNLSVTETQNSGASYTETTVAVTAGTWISVLASSTTRKRVILGDAAGLGCAYTFNASPSANEGFPFSLSGSANTYVFDQPAPINQIWVKCSASGTVTVGAL